ncbi:MAG: S8 family serine peptidase [Bdellovibrionales bacterium]|nr:S8 family serine peptidase [Bdellovibrionales bacterium]
MKKLIIIFFALLLSACDKDNNQSGQTGFLNKPESPGCQSSQLNKQFLVVWKDGSVSREYAANKEDFIENFMKENEAYIQFAEPDYVVQFTPLGKGDNVTSSLFDNWGAANVGADKAWQKGARGEGVKVAVIDSGADIYHQSLKEQIDINQNEIPGNGLDDDGNGYVDDYNGYSFVTHDDDVSSSSLHGTHVSGIIAAQHFDMEVKTDKMQGIAPGSKIVPLKFIDVDGGGLVSDAIAAIDYALSRGAKVINASWGGGCSESLRVKINQLVNHDVLFIAAAGNSYNNIDVLEEAEYPAAYSTESMLTVGAITRFNGMALFSNYGEEKVHLFAPGERIISTIPNQSYQSLDGTSMSTPFVSGAAAVLWSLQPTLTAQDVKSLILQSVRVEKDESYPNITNGRLDLACAVSKLNNEICEN